MNSKLISISAISAGLVALFLTIGAYVEMTDVFMIVIASAFVILPLYYKSYKASILTYLAGGLIAFMISGFNLLSLVFPAYFAFFGIYPIVKNYMMEKKFNKIAGFVLGLIWFLLVAVGLYFYYTAFMGVTLDGLPQWFAHYALLFVVLIAIVFFVIFDRFIVVAGKAIFYYLRRFLK